VAEFNPRRLKLARRRRGMTKRGLAATLGVSERIVNAYEAGAKEPSEETLSKLVKTLVFPVAFFQMPDPAQLPEGGPTFRSLSRMPAGKRDRALAGGELGIELANWLEERFHLPEPDVPDMRYTRDPESAALALRTRWKLSDKPIAHMVRLLEAKGVRVFSLAEEGDEVDAFSFWDGERPFIFLNTMKSSERSRFDAAHELGHLVLHRHGSLGGRAAEQEADRFASAFLMPQSSILSSGPWFPTLELLIKAKRGWNVAVSALAYRLHALRLVSDWHYRMLCIEIQQAGYRSAEPDSAPREMSLVFEKMFEALRAEGKTKAAVAENLNWPVSELTALVFGLVMHVRGNGSGAGARSHASANGGGSLSLLS
jgi:Zn-dependent peptidase ImmA (M78 family)/DNA-binding XRE family transcriptional regulator